MKRVDFETTPENFSLAISIRERYLRDYLWNVLVEHQGAKRREVTAREHPKVYLPLSVARVETILGQLPASELVDQANRIGADVRSLIAVCVDEADFDTLQKVYYQWLRNLERTEYTNWGKSFEAIRDAFLNRKLDKTQHGTPQKKAS